VPPRLVAAFALVLASLALAAPADAHHEAIFGPQSSILLTPPAYVSLQLFSRRLGKVAPYEDATGLVSAGLAPFSQIPLALTLTLPVGYSTEEQDAHAHLDDVIFGVRYGFDLPGVAAALSLDEVEGLVSAALELPTSTGHGAVGRNVSGMLAGLLSAERGRLSAMAFAFGVINGADAEGDRDGHELFTGLGAGYAILRSSKVSLNAQLGVAFEHRARSHINDMTIEGSGGTKWLASPTLLAQLGRSVLAFAIAGVPFAGTWRDPASEERWRVGGGLMYVWGGDERHTHGADGHEHGDHEHGGSHDAAHEDHDGAHGAGGDDHKDDHGHGPAGAHPKQGGTSHDHGPHEHGDHGHDKPAAPRP
jgi:hypothetical protein